MYFGVLTAFLIYIASFSSASAVDNIFEALKLKAAYLGERQSVLARNVANANTPGYKAEDLAEIDFGKIDRASGNRLSVSATSSGHISPRRPKVKFKRIRHDDSYETTIDGNNVVLEDQLVKMSENELEYRTTLGLMRKMSGLIKTAIGDSSQ